MPDVLRQNAPPVANDFLHSAGLSPDEIDLVRKLVGHTIAAVECGLISAGRRRPPNPPFNARRYQGGWRQGGPDDPLDLPPIGASFLI